MNAPDYARLQKRANEITDDEIKLVREKRRLAEKRHALIVVCRQLGVDHNTLLHQAQRRYDEVFHLGR